jgi:putative protease
MVELLAPAGSCESLRAAVNAGADAVYIGGSRFGARAYADNPGTEDLIDGIRYCHLHGRKIYMTVNTLLKEQELEEMLYDFLLPYYENGLDGVIVQDFGVVSYMQEHFPGMEVHASTQMTVTGVDGARFLKERGLTRVVPARELSLPEIRRIIDETGIEVETFIHGAMCYSYSGQCLLSSMIGGRSGNRGRCAQPCRLPYSVVGSGDGKKSYLLSMKDMCTIDLLPDLIEAGIASLKIEGRMKRAEYTAGVVRVYRKYIDLYQKNGRAGYRVSQEDRRILEDLYNRGGFSDGYYRQHNGKTMMAMTRPNHQGTEAARVKSAGKGTVGAVALEPLHRGDVLELAGGSEVTLAQDVRANAVFQLRQPPQVKLSSGSMIYRTRNDVLLQELNDSYLKTDLKEKIKGELRIFPNSPAILKLSSASASVTVTAAIAEPAGNRPTDEDAVRRQMLKTGNTPFQFESLDIAMDPELFIPVRSLNELRREGLERLEEAILAPFCRKAEAQEQQMIETQDADPKQQTIEAQDTDARSDTKKQPDQVLRMNVLVTSREQLEAVLDAAGEVPIDTIYLDSLLLDDGKSNQKAGKAGRSADQKVGSLSGHTEDALSLLRRIQAAGIRCCISAPPVFREKERRLFAREDVRALMAEADGFLLHTIEEAAYFRTYVREEHPSAELIADDSLYAYNRRSEVFLHEAGIDRTTLPSELNFRELLKLGAKGRELIVYGHQPLMHSAQCVTKNTKGCTKKPEFLYLQDRKKARFPVLNRCAVCCNTIYNSVPLALGGCRSEILALSPASIRLSFTIESAEETGQILRRYHALLMAEHPDEVLDSSGRGQIAADAETAGTRGHFKRGVE